MFDHNKQMREMEQMWRQFRRLPRLRRERWQECRLRWHWRLERLKKRLSRKITP